MSRNEIARSRRQFLGQTAVGGVALPLLMTSRSIAGAAERLNIAAVGVGGKGRSDIASTSKGHNVVAICDVDKQTLTQSAKEYSGAKQYTDWRKMLEQKDIDAVTVSTPDHMHAPIAITAMEMGKHVYVQKPLAHTLFEARQMRLVAKQHNVVTQMGNQGHSGSGYKTVVRLIQEGVIGKVKEAHAWSNRPIWPQGIRRSEKSDPVPDWLEWELWLGVAPNRPYVGPAEGAKKPRGAYHPFNWRGWLDFGVGALGDMGCHIIDPVVWSCGLGAPTKVWSEGPIPNGETFPAWGIIQYEFPGTKFTSGDNFRMTWYDGGKKPDQKLAQLDKGEKLPDNGSLYVGENGVILCPHGKNPTLHPNSKFDQKIELEAHDDHYQQWTNACLGNGKTTSNFDYAGPLTETVLLGTVAIRFPEKRLEWDSKSMKFTNEEQANHYLHHQYRKGWEVPTLTRG
ncbi:MAG: putative dehydrogenase [Pirellulaceae bacterium]|jgi:predicted dehydrogenase